MATSERVAGATAAAVPNDNDHDDQSTVYHVEHLATFSTLAAAAAHGQETRLGLTSRPTVKNGAQTASELLDDHEAVQEPRVALERLFELEKLSGIWTQRMQIELRQEQMLVLDCETNSVVERFCKQQVTKPESFSQYNDIYSNIIVFTVEQEHDKQKPEDQEKEENLSCIHKKSPKESSDKCQQQQAAGELHIFQCVSHQAQQLVSDILAWKQSGQQTESNSSMARSFRDQEAAQKCDSSACAAAAAAPTEQPSDDNREESSSALDKIRGASANELPAGKQQQQPAGAKIKPPLVVTSSLPSSGADDVPIVNVNVKETVQVFNQIAALREKSAIPSSPTNHAPRPLSDSSIGSTAAAAAAAAASCPRDGAQLYKQRSIRAVLAPAQGAAPAASQTQPEKPTTSNGSSSAATDAKATTHSKAPAPEPTSNGKLLESNSRQVAQADEQNERGQQRARPHQKHHQTKQQLAGQPASSNSTKASNNKRQAPQAPRTRSSPAPLSPGQQLADQVATNESYVSVLNHCFDDIEKFIIRLQQAFAAQRELQHQQKLRRLPSGAVTAGAGATNSSSSSSSHSKRSSLALQANGKSASSSSASSGSSSSLLVGAKHHHNHQQQPLPPIPGAATGAAPAAANLSQNELATLAQRARGPSADDYFEILSKFKLAFNLLAKLKGCIHEPNAPELVHFLFTPLAIVIESARNVSPPLDPTLVGIPYLNRDALELLSNCCTSKESDLWLSLGPNWTQTIDLELLEASRLPSSFQPIFSDGWAPVISELELIGLPSAQLVAGAARTSPQQQHYRAAGTRLRSSAQEPPPHLVDEPVHQQHKSRARRHANHQASAYAAGHYHSQTGLAEVGYPAPAFVAAGAQVSDDYTELQHHEVPHYLLDEPPQLLNMQRNQNFQHPQMRHHRSSEQVYGRGAVGGAAPRPAPHSQRARRAAPKMHQMDPLDYELAGPDVYGGEPMPPAPMDHAALLAARQAMLLDLGPAQTEWFYELQARDALIVRVLFTRDANNDKELSVRRGELLEVLDDSRKWWRARNIDLQVAHVPHTIVALMDHYQTLDELLANTSDLFVSSSSNSAESMLAAGSAHYHQPALAARTSNGGHHPDQGPSSSSSSSAALHTRRNKMLASGQLNNVMMMMAPSNGLSGAGGAHDERRAPNSKAAGAFRYF